MILPKAAGNLVVEYFCAQDLVKNFERAIPIFRIGTRHQIKYLSKEMKVLAIEDKPGHIKRCRVNE